MTAVLRHARTPSTGQDFTGVKFSMLTGVRFSHQNGVGARLWVFQCECGRETTLPATKVKQGKTRSCGCLSNKVASELAKKNRLTFEEVRNLNDLELLKTESHCRRCFKTKPVSEFTLVKNRHNRRIYYSPRCSYCLSELAQTSRIANPEKYRLKEGLQKARYFKLKYGLTLEEVAVLTNKQSGKCAICTKELPLFVDHCHATGKVRAMLCKKCNFGLGQYLDEPTLLRAAANYLESHRPSPPNNSPDSDASLPETVQLLVL